jgi:hypothetical protein
MFQTPSEILARFGKPSNVSVSKERIVCWNYWGKAFWLSFNFHDGRVINISYRVD